MANFTKIMHRLQNAINTAFDVKLLIYTTQFYSDKKDGVCTCYHIKQSVYDNTKDRRINIEIFRAYSTVQCTLFLRDYWFKLNGWEVPHDNETWEQIKEERKNGKRPGQNRIDAGQ